MRGKLGSGLLLVILVLSTPWTVSARPPKPPESDEPTPAPTCRSLDTGPSAVAAQWGRASRSNGCFFFSGPYDLGRDDHLGRQARYERRGDQILVRFGDLSFSGQLRGDRVSLRRVSDHSYGSTWTVTEVIDARLVAVEGCTVLRGSYRYEECDTAAPQSCPGFCTITAPVTFSAR